MSKNLGNPIYETLLIKLLSQMKKGKLRVTMPRGESLIFGTQDGVLDADIRIRSAAFFRKCVLFGDVGFGEAYVDRDWDTTDLVALIRWMILNVEDHPTLMNDKPKNSPLNFLGFFNRLKHFLRANSVGRSRENIAKHYDLGNDFFSIFLDPGMTYSSALFGASSMSLAEAQENKYEALCAKLRIKPGDKVLEIGGGWGGFASHAAKLHHCRVKTITISKEQYHYMRERFSREGLGDKVEVELIDYRHVTGVFDKIASIEMIEAVGHEFLGTFFRQCHKLLKKEGLLGLQMILAPDHRYESFRSRPDWIQKYIFPGGLVPSFEAVYQAVRRTGDLTLHDYQDMTLSYARTLEIWRDNFNLSLARVRALGFDDAFIRKWNYYFCYCEAAFRMRNISVAQAVFSRANNTSLTAL